MSSRQSLVVLGALKGNALHVALLHVFQLRLDVLEPLVVAGGLVGEVGVAAAAVPVALDGLRRDVDLDVEVFRQAVHDVSAHPELVAHVDALDGAHLDLLLATQHFCVRAGHRQAGLQAVHHQRFGESAAEVVGASDRALVRSLGSREPLVGESERPWSVVVETHDGVLLLDSEPGLFVQLGVEDALRPVPEVGAVRLGELDVGVGLA